VVVALAVLTAVEYLVSAADVPALLLWLLLFAVGKAAVIVYAFMHLPEVFGEESR
jgi:cytochrome c oxidase subunit IV